MCPRKGGCGLVVEKEKVAEKGRQLCRSSLRVRWLCYSSGGILSLEREREREREKKINKKIKKNKKINFVNLNGKFIPSHQFILFFFSVI